MGSLHESTLIEFVMVVVLSGGASAIVVGQCNEQLQVDLDGMPHGLSQLMLPAVIVSSDVMALLEIALVMASATMPRWN